MEDLHVFEQMTIQSKSGPYHVSYELEHLDNIIDIQEGITHFLVDSKVANLYKESLNSVLKNPKTLIIEAREKNKSIGNITPLIENYLTDLKRFTLMRKNIPLNNTESVLLGEFEYDFESIHKSEYFLNPNSISKLKTSIQLKFFHTNKQQEHIANQQKLYSNHALGLGRLLQQTNLNLVFRSFEQNQ